MKHCKTNKSMHVKICESVFNLSVTVAVVTPQLPFLGDAA